MNITFGAAVFGALLKVYDDMEDNPVLAQYNTPQLMEIVKTLIIASFTYASIYDMNLPLIIFIFNYLHYAISDNTALSTYFYHGGMIVAFLLSIITFDISTISVVTIIITILICIMVGYMDNKLCPEEYSWKKIIFRTIYSIGIIVLLQFSVVDYHTMITYLSHFMTSILIMTYAQYNETKSPHPLKEPKEQVSQEAPISEEKEVRLQVE